MSAPHIWAPLRCLTGAPHQQPFVDNEANRAAGYACVRFGLWEFTPDYRIAVEIGGPIDAPDTLPRGGVFAHDFLAGDGRLLVAHVWRERP